MLSAKTGGAESFSYSLTQSSLLQLSRSVLSLKRGPVQIRGCQEDLAKSEHSLKLEQLAELRNPPSDP